MRKRAIRITACLAILALVLGYFALWGSAGKLSLYKSLLEASSGSDENAQRLQEIEKRLENLSSALEEDAPDEQASESASAASEALSELDTEVEDTKERQEAVFEELGIGGEILERHEAFYAAYEGKISRIEERLTSLEKGELSPHERAQLASGIGDLCKEREPEIIAGDLPWRSINLDQGSPNQTQGSASGFSTSDYTIPGDQPMAGDLEQTPDIVFTPEITDLAASLENDPLRIYEWVRNNVHFEPYYGSRKGAHMTLLEGRGNSADTASLLIALLRVSGYPARYAYGAICISPEEAESWLGIGNFPLACEIFAYSGIPTQPVVYGGNPLALYLEHAWVEAYLPYKNYRGDIITEEGVRWIPLDGSFKACAEEESINLSASIPFDRLSYLTSGADLASDYFIDICYDAYYQAYPGGSDPQSIFATMTVIPEELAILPNTLPYTSALSERFSSLPEHMRERINLTLKEEDGTPSLAYSAATCELLGRRLTLSYEPATGADRDALRATQDGKIPAYAVEVVPRIKLDGEVVAEGPAVGLGQDQYLTTETCWAAPTPERRRTTSFENEIPAGNYIGIGIKAGDVPAELVEASSARLYASQERVDAGEDVDPDDTLGELLYRNATDYLRKVDLSLGPLAQAMHARLTKHTSIGFSEINSGVDILAGSPRYLYLDGMIMDVDQLFYGVYIPGDDGSQELKFRNIAGCASSELEHLIFERGDRYLGIPAVSAIRILKLANGQGMDIYEVNPSNISTVLPLIDAPASIKEDVADDIHQGREVIIHKSEVTHHDWSGFGWITQDPRTGGAAYKIAGGIAGGSTADIRCLAYLLVYFSPSGILAGMGCNDDMSEKYEDWVFDLHWPLDANAVCNTAEGLLGTPFSENPDMSNLYESLLSGMPCIGVPAYCYDKGGVRMWTMMITYELLGCDPDLKGWAGDDYLSLRAENWEKYFVFCENRYADARAVAHYNRGCVDYYDPMSYAYPTAQRGDVVFTKQSASGWAGHAALIVEVGQFNRVTRIIGTSTSMGVVRAYGLDYFTNDFTGEVVYTNEFFALEQENYVTIAGYPAHLVVGE